MRQVTLTQEIQKVLCDAGISGKVDVEETCIPGVVKLSGQVASEDEKLKADQAVRSVAGVLDVMDELRLGRSSGFGRSSG